MDQFGALTVLAFLILIFLGLLASAIKIVSEFERA
jgi:Na+-transporting methylmalonyl-CoA/oxaloacetate decarboxylase gamma subunit